jgi:hypothetical protein
MDTAPRNLAWKLNWYRQSELEGALLLGKLVRHAPDADLVGRLTRHCADEARHSQLWSECIATLGLPAIAIRRSYQSLFAERGGLPANLVEVLAFTQVFERRVHKRFNDELTAVDLPAAARVTFETMIADEKDHLAWVHAWLKTQPEARSLLEHYRTLDEEIYRSLLPYEACLWQLEIGNEYTNGPTSVSAVLRNG